VEQENSQNKK